MREPPQFFSLITKTIHGFEYISASLPPKILGRIYVVVPQLDSNKDADPSLVPNSRKTKAKAAPPAK